LGGPQRALEAHNLLDSGRGNFQQCHILALLSNYFELCLEKSTCQFMNTIVKNAAKTLNIWYSEVKSRIAQLAKAKKYLN
jgi:hypothetical protein